MPRSASRHAARSPSRQRAAAGGVAFGQSAPALLAAGDSMAAEQAARRLIRQSPRHPEAWHWLGLALAEQKRTSEALSALRTARIIMPSNAEALLSETDLLITRKDFQAAVDVLHRAPELLRVRADLLVNLSAAYSALKHLDAAIDCGQQAVRINPALLQAWFNLGLYLIQASRYEEAEAALLTARDLQPDFALTWVQLATVYRHLGRLSAAEDAARRAVTLAPNNPDAHAVLGYALRQPGRAVEALRTLDHTIALDPNSWSVHQSMLWTALADETLDEADLLARHRAFANHCPPALPLSIADPRPDRRLRIAFLSGDMRTHVVALRLLPLLRHLDRAVVEIVGCSQTKLEDEVTAEIRRLCDQWLPTAPLSDADLVRRLRADQIDIAIDLAGHTADNRLRALARRCAPVQAHWVGYPGTTGVPAMDWRLADAVLVPPELDWMYTERVWRMPRTLHCFDPPADAPPVRVAPGAAAGRPVVGCFARPHKVSEETLATAGALLAADSTIRLRFQYEGLDDPGTIESTRARLVHHGATPEQIEFRGHQPLPAFLDSLGEVDVILDPYPFNGSTMSFYALWMGVPVVTRIGPRWVARNGAMFLEAIGLPELITRDRGGQIAEVLALLKDPPRLANLRVGLRQRLQASPFLDHPGMARDFEAMLRALWHLRLAESSA
ncbi:MAG: tetratricopeptide repeat protein [Alphaproteobacteria bacterium]|nr:MAG: tetratricopeptide repeat protein [Alphaproteobacteria bacterium]